ncbi:TonB-dependent receptor [Flavobacterium tructae]|uniref:outer membrane beta-barrel family protein n=1 Tax=Flavobacterium tructae TaxID=1114873 RepID=UPI000B5C02F3|nr:outer membrane beta-barrel family protein [Flavobacterium tructae]OXB23982.1 TonB-dependent receptor [Flavobacterium tructae]
MNINLLVKLFLILFLFLFSLAGYAQSETPKDSLSNTLNEVVIAQNKKTFINTNGNVKVDVANSIYNVISNTVDLLAKLPTVQISSDRESISIVGRGNPLIYIDNQKVGMSDLNALAVADIKTIEIIQNPSSKYEAEGRAVILITRKFSKKDRFKTEISEVASFKKKYNNYLGFNTSFKKNKLEWKANFNYNKLQPWENHSINYQIPNAEIASKYDVEAYSKKRQFIFGVSLFYKINEEDYFSFSVNSKLQKDIFPIHTITYNKNKEIENNVLTYSDNDTRKNFVNSFLNYNKKIKAIDAQVFTGLQWSNFDQALWSNVKNKYNETQFEWAQLRDQKFKVNVFSGRIDAEKKFKNEMKFEIGGLYSSAGSKSDFDLLHYENDEREFSHYDFKEQNLAGYSQFSGKIKKVEFSAGVRVENTNVDGKFKADLTPLIRKNYTNFFPKVQLSFAIDSLKSISVNYAKSISRPNYSSLSQGTTYINPYFLYARNINLDPTIVNEISSTFQYHDKSVKLTYYQNTNPVYNSFFFDKELNIMTFKDVNFEKESALILDFELPFTYRFWTTTNSLVLVSEKIEDSSAVFRSSKPYFYYYSNNEFRLPKDYVLVVGFRTIAKQYKGVFERNARTVVDVAVSKTFFKNWSCVLSFNNVFKSITEAEVFAINNISSKSRYLIDEHEISVSVKYSFGKVKESEFKGKRMEESSDRIR